jgi:uncharacterized membrane protein YesL
MKFLSYDSKFSQLLIKVCYACWLNLLWFICSIPVVTMGAATTALYDATLRIASEEDTNVTKHFFDALRRNFKQATRIWLIMLAVAIVMGMDAYAVLRLRATSTGTIAIMWTLNLALLISATLVYVIISIYLYPLIAKFENTDFNMFKNALLLGLRYLFCSIMVFLIHAAMAYAIIMIFTPLVIFGEGVCALLSSYLLVPVLNSCAYTKPRKSNR